MQNIIVVNQFILKIKSSHFYTKVDKPCHPEQIVKGVETQCGKMPHEGLATKTYIN